MKPYYDDGNGIVIYHGDCLKVMPELENDIDMVLADPPYGMTACSWDSIIPFEPMWKELKRLIKPNRAIVMTASQPFTTILISSNMEMFMYEWIWNKKKAGNIFLAKYQPMKIHENVLVFADGRVKYNPQMILRNKIIRSKNCGTGEAFGGDRKREDKIYTYTHKYPTTIIESSNASQKGKAHPTQKPIALMEYLIKTYTNEGDTVLDFAMGSGTTAAACQNIGRKCIGIEIEERYCEIAAKRLNIIKFMEEHPEKKKKGFFF